MQHCESLFLRKNILQEPLKLSNPRHRVLRFRWDYRCSVGCGTVLVELNHLVPQVPERQQCILWNRVFMKFYVKRAGTMGKKVLSLCRSPRGQGLEQSSGYLQLWQREESGCLPGFKRKGKWRRFSGKLPSRKKPTEPWQCQGKSGGQHGRRGGEEERRQGQAQRSTQVKDRSPRHEGG